MYWPRISRWARGFGATGMPMELKTPANTGLRKKSANCASFSGSSMLKRSLEPVAMMSSMMRELPMRCTCGKGPKTFSGLRDRHTPRAHVGWNREQRLPLVQASGFSVLDDGYGVILAQAQTFGACSVQRRDRRDTSNASHQSSEQGGLTDFGGETELEDYVFHS